MRFAPVPLLIVAWSVFATGGPLSASTAAPSRQHQAGKIAAKPLYRDPTHDGAADPVVIWNRQEQSWFMFYTNRRAKGAAADEKDKKWIHGTRIGIAESRDGGASWSHRGTATIQHGEEDYTHWAPEVIEHEGRYHMYLTVVPGIFDSWNHPRSIVHLTSSDLLTWKYESTLQLASDRVIDACVMRMPTGKWRMWYNNERDHKSIYQAESDDLYRWRDLGKVPAVNDRPGEGPKVFRWQEKYWMIVDVWRGQGVYHSQDAESWIRQDTDLLGVPGTGPDDNEFGRHADVVVNGDRAYLFYFTHPGLNTPEAKTDGHARTRSSIQVVELTYNSGKLSCDRDAPTRINLVAPSAR
jgi:hypothetical protein